MKLFKQRLFKQALPMALSVAMIFQSIPITAFAAEETADVSATAEDITMAEATADTSTTETTVDVEEVLFEKATEVIEAASGETQFDEPSVTEEIDSEENDSEEETTESIPGGGAINRDNSAEAKAAKIKISDDLELNGFKRELGENEYVLFTRQYAPKWFSNVQSTINNNITISVDGETLTGLNKSLRYVWEIKKDDAYAAIENDGVPKNVGEYRLHIILDKVEGLCEDAEAFVYFAVEKKELKPQFANLLSAAPSDTIGEFKKRLLEGYAFNDPDADKKNIVNHFTVNVYEVSVENGAKSEQPLSDDALFYYNKNYIMVADRPELTTDAAINYEVVVEEYYSVTVRNLMQTQVTVELDDPGKAIGKIYDGTAADTSLLGIKKDNNVELITVYKLVNGKPVELKDAKAEPAWYVRSNPAEDNADALEYTKLDEAPVDAGEYYVMYEYVPEGDDANLYTKSESEPIEVTIHRAPLYLAPTTIEVFEGMTQDELKKALAEADFDLFITVNGSYKGGAFEYPAGCSKEEFFGTAYSGDGNKDRRQYYHPEFELQIREKVAEKAGDEVKFDDNDKWMNVSPNYLPLKATMSSRSEKREYRLKFTGNKILYDQNGEVIDASRAEISDTSTNSADKNHVVTYDDPLTVTVNIRPQTEINKDEIIRAFTEKNPENKGDGTLENPAYKVYDRDSLFNEGSTRGDYKHAVLYENGAATDIKDTDAGFTYTWYYTTIDKYEAYISEDDDGKKQFINEGSWNWREITNINSDNTDPDDGTLVKPTDSGFYKLDIRYKDPKNNRLSAQKDVYFFIKQQEIIVAAEDRYVVDGDVWNDDSTKYPPLVYTIYEVPDNDIDKFNNMYENEAERANLKLFAGFDEVSAFNLVWNVRRQKFDANGNAAVGADNQPLYERIWQSGNASSIMLYKNRQYQIYAYIDGLEQNAQYKNYTCKIRPVNQQETDDQVMYRFLAGNILFTDGELDIAINQDKIPATRVYNGAPIAQSVDELDGLITIKDKSGTDVTSALLNTGTEYNGDLVNVRWFWMADDRDGKTVMTQDALYGGTYYLCIDFAGNAQYAAYSYNAYYDYSADNMNAYSFRITKKEITVRPVLIQDGIRAGIPASRLYGLNPEDGSNRRPAVIVDGLADCDSQIFTYRRYQGRYRTVNGNTQSFEVMGYPAFYDSEDDGKILDAIPNYDFTITVAEDSERIGNPRETYLKYGRTYDVKYTGELAYPYKTSYDITYQAESAKIEKRGAADVTGVRFFADTAADAVDVRYEYDEESNTYTIIPREGIRFYYGVNGQGAQDIDGNNIPFTDGNYIALAIYAPKEFEGDVYGNGFDSSKIIYKNGVKAAGGYVLADWHKVNNVNGAFIGHAITVLFPVTTDENGKLVEIGSFAITWEGADGTAAYVERFQLDLTGASLETDLRKAVAPKSLAFNGVSTKMAVGETQQLDVKVGKSQLADIISLRYRLSGGGTKNDYLSVDPETGVVTALQESKTAIEVEAYPVFRAADGTIQEITGKGVKTAKVKITVTVVSAPAIKGTVASDLFADIRYLPVNDGYRRELYLVKVADKSSVKEWTKDKFESEISNMKNGQWKGTFAIAPVFWADEQPDELTGLVLGEIGDLMPNTQYVLYLRNVSSPRTLDDDSKVTFSHNGSVTSFVTLKSRVKKLEPYFTVNENNTADKKNTVVRNENGDYTVALASKTAQLNVYGLFEEKEDGNQAADTNDLRRYNLPLAKNQKEMLAHYLDPKLTYRIYDSDDKGQVTAIVSKYATISNSGKIALKGVDLDGTVKVWIEVTAENFVGRDGLIIGRCPLYITANPDNVAGRKVKLKVGDTIALADCLDYKEGKTKVPYHRSSGMEILTKTEDIEKAGYKLTIDKDNQAYITVEKPNKTAFALEVKDKKIGADGMTATVTLTSSQLDPIKGLKAVYVDNQRITINFGYQGNAEAFVLEVKDARGSVVSKTLIENNITPLDPVHWIGVLEPEYRQRQQQWILNTEILDNTGAVTGVQRLLNELAYFENTKTYSYTISNTKIVRKSAYTISLTPVYGANKADKPAIAKAKTTDIPAAWNVNMDAIWSPNGGIGVNYGNIPLTQRPYFTSGNTYTLDSGITSDAKDRCTDTLTWKSSNSKVASIKAVPGTYTATLKAMQQGTTIIEVTSKITKKVIARYPVRVKAVGKGEPGFGGDYEPSWDSAFYMDVLARWDPLYQGRLETLTLTNDVIVNNPDNRQWDGTWVSFTAPEFGKYTFTRTGGNFVRIYDGRKLDDTTRIDGTLVRYLEKGQRIYLKLTGNFTLSVSATPFAGLSADNGRDNPLTIKTGEWISFTAPTDNYYIFDGVDITRYMVSRTDEAVSDANSTTRAGGSLSIVLKAGTTLYMQARPKDATESSAALWVDYAKASLTDSNRKEETEISLSRDNDTSYIKFYAKEARNYKFVYEDITGVDVRYLVIKEDSDGKTDSPRQVGSRTEQELSLAKGETVILQFKANSNAFSAETASVKAKAYVEFEEPLLIAVGKDASVSANSTKLIAFDVPDNGKFIFKVHRDNANIIQILSDDLQTLVSVRNSETAITVKDDEPGIKKGDRIYLEVQNNTQETTGDAGAARVTAAQVPFEALALGKDNAKTLVINNYCSEYWYAFTAEKEGYYEFAAAYKDEDSENAEADTKPRHGILSAYTYRELFGGYTGSLDITLSKNGKTAARRYMNAGETVTFCLNASTVSGVDNIDLKTEAVFTVTDVAIKTLAADAAAESVSLAQENEEVYYSFTAKQDDTYTFTYTPGKDSGSARILLKKDSPDNSNLNSGTVTQTPFQKTHSLSAGEKVYIIVRSTDSTTAVSGDLKITSTKALEITLKSGEKTEFSLEPYPNGTKYYKFTAPENSEVGSYSVIVNVKSDSTGITPNVRVTIEDGVNPDDNRTYNTSTEPYNMIELYKGDTIRVQLSNYGDSIVTGDITIAPIQPELIDGEKKPVVTFAKSMWYKYRIPEEGRYHFPIEEGPNNKHLTVTYMVTGDTHGAGGEIYDPNGRYLQKGDMVYLLLSSGADSEQHATVKVPEKITPKQLKIEEENLIEVKASEGNGYYEYTVPENGAGYYNFTSEGLNLDSCFVYDNYRKRDYTLEEGYMTYFRAGMSLFFRVPANGEDVEGKITVTKANATLLKDGETSVPQTVKSGSGAYFAYTIYEPGLYAFRTVDVETEASYGLYGSFAQDRNVRNVLANTSFDKGFYYLREYDSNAVTAEQLNELLIVENYTGDDVTFKVRAEKIIPQELTADAEDVLTIAELKKNDYQFFSFKAPEKARYRISVDNKDVNIAFIDRAKSSDILLEKGEEIMLYLTYTGERNAVNNVKLSVETVTTEAAGGTQHVFKVPAHDAKWIEYTFSSSSLHSFTLKKGVAGDYDTLHIYNRILDSNESSDTQGKNRKIYTTFAKQSEGENADKLLIRIENTSGEDMDYVLDVATKSAVQIKEQAVDSTMAFKTYGQTELLSYTADTAGQYQITASVADDAEMGDFQVEYYNGKGGFIRSMNAYSATPTLTMDTNSLEAGEMVYIKVYPYSQGAYSPDAKFEHDIKIKIDKIIQ